jgi:hypothetical protein
VPLSDDKQQDPRLVSKLPGAFNFMEKRPFDVVVIIRTLAERSALLRRMELFYAERGRISSFLFDFSEPKYLTDRGKFHEACARALFKEVRSRAVARDEFVVWFYNEQDRDTMLQISAGIAGEDENMLKSLEELTSHARITGVDHEPDLLD